MKILVSIDYSENFFNNIKNDFSYLKNFKILLNNKTIKIEFEQSIPQVFNKFIIDGKKNLN